MTVPNHEGAQQQPDTLPDALERLKRYAQIGDMIAANRASPAAIDWRVFGDHLRSAVAALDSAQLVGQPLEERYWCGCVRSARWERCERHHDLDHDEEPGTQAEESDALVGQQQQPSEPQRERLRAFLSHYNVQRDIDGEEWPIVSAKEKRGPADYARYPLYATDIAALLAESQPHQRTQPASEPAVSDDDCLECDGSGVVEFETCTVCDGTGERRERCEGGCDAPVTHHDGDGVPLCTACWEALPEISEYCHAERCDECEGCGCACHEPVGDEALRVEGPAKEQEQ